MNEFQHIVRSGPSRPTFILSTNLDQRAAIFLAWFEQPGFGIGRFGLDVDGEVALYLLPS